nr:MAG TPA: aragonite protein [Caudoviricetes sp.]
MEMKCNTRPATAMHGQAPPCVDKLTKRKPCPVRHTEQGEGTNLNHKILCSRCYYITPAGERQGIK